MPASNWSQAALENRERFFDQIDCGSLALFFAQNAEPDQGLTAYGMRVEPNFFYLLPYIASPAAGVLYKDLKGEKRVYLFREFPTEAKQAWSQRPIDCTQGELAEQLNGIYPYESLQQHLERWLNECHCLYGCLDSTVAPLDELLKLCQKNQAKKIRLGQALLALKDWRGIMSRLRVEKSAFELICLERAVTIASQAHLSAMRNISVWQTELQLMSHLYHQFLLLGACGLAYPAIVAGSDRGCMLHYHSNREVLDSDALVLVDAGCFYQGYASDITRTYPKSGRFTQAQREIYELVLAAQIAAIEQIRPGASFQQLEQAAVTTITAGLIRLGLLEGSLEELIAAQAYRAFYMHSIGHWIGLEVHDLGPYGENRRFVFRTNMVLTVEPGIYIPAHFKHRRYQGICVRIEDVVQVTSTGFRILSKDLPRAPQEIEALCDPPSLG